MKQSRLSASSKRVITLGALLLVVMFKFQNCAPAPMQNQAAEGPIEDGQVRIVDRWAVQKVSFVSKTQYVEGDAQPVQVQGLCLGSEKGTQIAYQVIALNEAPQVILDGVVDCVMGSFELVLKTLRFQSCMTRYQVRASRIGEDEYYAETMLQPNCSG
jgi:hypothetical protein